MTPSEHEAYLRELAARPLIRLHPAPIAHPSAPWILAAAKTHAVMVPDVGQSASTAESWPSTARMLWDDPDEDTWVAIWSRGDLLLRLGPVPRTPCPYCSGTGEEGAGPSARRIALADGVVVDRHLLARVLWALRSPRVALWAPQERVGVPLRVRGLQEPERAAVARYGGSDAGVERIEGAESEALPDPEPEPKGEIDSPLEAGGELRCPSCESRNFHRGVCYSCGFEA